MFQKILSKKKKRTEKPIVSSPQTKDFDEPFVPLAMQTQIYANEIHRALSNIQSGERVTINISETMCVIKFEKENKTYIKIYDGVWKQM